MPARTHTHAHTLTHTHTHTLTHTRAHTLTHAHGRRRWSIFVPVTDRRTHTHTHTYTGIEREGT